MFLIKNTKNSVCIYILYYRSYLVVHQKEEKSSIMTEILLCSGFGCLPIQCAFCAYLMSGYLKLLHMVRYSFWIYFEDTLLCHTCGKDLKGKNSYSSKDDILQCHPNRSKWELLDIALCHRIVTGLATLNYVHSKRFVLIRKKCRNIVLSPVVLWGLINL